MVNRAEHQKKPLKAMREVNAMKRLDHVHIVKYFGNIIKDGNQGPGMYIIYYMHDTKAAKPSNAALASFAAAQQTLLVDHLLDVRTAVFDKFPENIYILSKYKTDVFKELERKHNVKVTIQADGKSVSIEGTRDDNANFGHSLDKHLKDVFHDFHTIDDRARVQHINDDPEFLETVGLKNNCLVVKHVEGDDVQTAVEPEPLQPATSRQTSCLYSVTLPSGTVCEVKRTDITSLSHDAIVNAANGDLQHVGGLAYAIAQKGGSGIQQECNHYIRNYGKLIEGEVMTSSPGNLSCKKIIHAVGPRWVNGVNHEERTLFNCVDNCFLETEKEKMQSIAIPPISTGIFGFPVDLAVKAIVGAIEQREKKNQYLPQLISLVDNKSDSLQLFETELRQVFDKSPPRKASPVKPSSSIKAGPSHSSSSSGTKTLCCILVEVFFLSVLEPTGGAVAGVSEVFIEEETCKLAIYANSPQDIQRCKLDLDTKLDKAMATIIWKDRSGYAADREFIVQLTQNQIRRLKSEADKLRVNLTVDQRNANIKINGRQADVFKMTEIVSAQLKNIEKGVVEKKEEELVALARQWEYEEDGGQWAKFDLSINKALEDTYLKNANAIYSYETSDGAVKVDIGAMKLRCGGTEINVRRLDLSKPQTTELSLPSTWTKPLDVYGEVTIGAGTPEYTAVETAFMSTLGAGTLDDTSVETAFMSTLGARGNSIIEIKRVQNPTLYKQYLLLRKEVAKRLGRQEDQVETTPLWHGTDVDTVSKITAGKFDRGYIGKNAAMYGNGTYFAKNSSYSAQPQYSHPDARGHRYIIQTRVITGDWTKGHKV
ncbi:PARP14 [Bugula neritina]|uniref:Poly [ADP-ribose] polymerase n=1 Tax=Bugula neritina TaxID=10212 RepID=A0A7J7KJT6_BUGNE|nr:PARP14 [Bugula neritina]